MRIIYLKFYINYSRWILFIIGIKKEICLNIWNIFMEYICLVIEWLKLLRDVFVDWLILKFCENEWYREILIYIIIKIFVILIISKKVVFI